MKRLMCGGCGTAEDLNNPTGDIHPVQIIDQFPLYDALGKPDEPLTEDLCSRCRKKLRQQFFGEPEAELLDMPLMKSV